MLKHATKQFTQARSKPFVFLFQALTSTHKLIYNCNICIMINHYKLLFSWTIVHSTLQYPFLLLRVVFPLHICLQIAEVFTIRSEANLRHVTNENWLAAREIREDVDLSISNNCSMIKSWSLSEIQIEKWHVDFPLCISAYKLMLRSWFSWPLKIILILIWISVNMFD